MLYLEKKIVSKQTKNHFFKKVIFDMVNKQKIDSDFFKESLKNNL